MKRIIQKGKPTAIITTEGMKHFKRAADQRIAYYEKNHTKR